MTEEYHSTFVRSLFAMWGGIAGLWLALPLTALGEATPDGVLIAAFVGLIAVGTWRGATVRVLESDDGLVVRNLFRTYSIRWTDVTDIGWCGRWETRFESVSPYLRVRGRRRRLPLLAMTKMGTLFRNRPTPFTERVTATVTRWRSRLVSPS